MELSSIGPQANVPAPPPPPPGWPAMPPPKRPGLPTWAIVVIVIVVVVVVLVSIVVAAVLYILATPIDGPNGVRPVIVFGQPQAVINGFEFQVAGASQALAAATYRVALFASGTSIGTERVLAASLAFGSYTITWTDLGGEGDLTAGDVFRVTQTGGLPPNTDFMVDILWTDGSLVGSRGYTTDPVPIRPVITFGQPEAVTNGFEFQVAGASETLAAANYRVAITVNGTTIGTARTLTASMAFGPYTITWTDLGGEGDLTGGDVFRMTRPGGLPANTDFLVSLLWSDGAAVGTRDYAT